MGGGADNTCGAVGVGVVYLVFAFLYIYPSLRLWQYASSISLLEVQPNTFNLETALDRQRSFWKFVGIMITIMLVFYAGIIMLVMIAGAAGSMR